CYGPPPSDNSSISQLGQQEQSKNPPVEGRAAGGRAAENGKEKEPDKDSRNGKQEQSKNPPSEKASTGNGNGKETEKENEPKTEWYSAHAQATVVTQAHDAFRSPYAGPNSLLPHEPSATSMTGTLFLDARLWACEGYTGELVFNPEIAGGRGFSGTTGIAGF